MGRILGAGLFACMALGLFVAPVSADETKAELEKLKQEANAPIIVMVTANQGKRHMVYAQNLCVDAYLNKPVPLSRLVDTIVRLLEERAA